MTFEHLQLTIDSEGIATITLNRPERLNAFGRQLERELREVVQQVASERAVRVLVLTGAGRAFCAGGDLTEMREPGGWDSSVEERSARFRALHEIPALLHDMAPPTIAMVNGVAAGGGFSLALACDLRIAATTAKFGSAYVKVGLADDTGGAWFLSRLVGPAKALELYLSGEVIDAEEALRIGMVNRVVPAEELAETTYAFARRLARGPRDAIALIKQTIQGGLRQPLREFLEEEAGSVARQLDHPDHREAAAAFVEKREARFR